MRVKKVRPGFESLIQCRNTFVFLTDMSQEPDPEDGDGAVVLPGVAPDFGDMSDREVGYVFRLLDTRRLIEKGPGKTKMRLVAEVLLPHHLTEQT